MRRPTVLPLVIALFTASVTAQLQGTYTIGPAGTYPTFTAAAAALGAGVSGPVRFFVQPGIYNESFTLPTVTGASATNTVTFMALPQGAAKLTGASGPTLTFALGTVTAPTAWYVLDGLEFTGGPGVAVLSNRYVNDVEIRNCTFLAGHTTYVLNLQGANISRWKVHHNKFTLIPSQRGCYLSQIDNCLFYSNDFDLNGCSYGWYCINSNNSRNRAFNNLFHGALQNIASSYCIYMAASQYDWELSLNTFVVDTGSAGGKIIQVGGCCTTRFTNIYGNVFVNLGAGPIYQFAVATPVPVYTYYRGDGNVFYEPANANPNVVMVGTTPYDLTAWKALTGQDTASVVLNPQLFSITPPNYDLRPIPTSPVKDKGVAFPGYATLPAFPIEDDHAGTIRDSVLDAGAYELRPVFGRFRSGCAGSGNFTPEIGATGPLAIPSPTFGVTLTNALGPAPALFTLGTSATNWGGFNLPLDIGGGCSIQNDLVITLGAFAAGAGPGTGTATLPMPIPNNPTFIGVSLYVQWLVADPGTGSFLGLTASRSGAIQF